MANKKGNSDKLVVTNYDNFKNAAFFIKQYHQAKAMLKEVDDFFESFVMSKIYESNGFSKRDLKFKSVDMGEWLHHIRKDDTYHPSNWQGKLSYLRWYGDEPDRDKDGNIKRDEKGHWIYKKKANYDETLKEAMSEMLEEPRLDKEKKYNTYYVIDKDGVLYDFIPVASKDTIKIDFTKKFIEISGHYYRYYECGAQWGKSSSSMKEIKVTIFINPSNNNVEKVTRTEKIVQEGNANGKAYYEPHDDYCLSSLVGKDVVQTPYN